MSLDLASWPLSLAVPAFIASAAVILVAGVKLAGLADLLAKRTGLGEVVAGALFVGVSTSLAGSISAMVSAAEGRPDMAVGIGVGGIAFQTVAIVVADMVYRKANLEHAAASATGLAQAVLLIILLALPLSAQVLPEMTVWRVHPLSPLLLAAYAYGLRQLAKIKEEPMWRPVQTSDTGRKSQPEHDGRTTGAIWWRFILFAGLMAATGWAMAKTGTAISESTGLSDTAVGALLTGTATSLPELVTAIAAVRRGAVQLAIGDIIGGNAFDVLFLAGSDVFYRGGSIYHAMGADNRFVLTVSIIMTGVLLLGLIRRERVGPGRIGFESVTVLLLYAATVVALLMMPP